MMILIFRKVPYSQSGKASAIEQGLVSYGNCWSKEQGQINANSSIGDMNSPSLFLALQSGVARRVLYPTRQYFAIFAQEITG